MDEVEVEFLRRLYEIQKLSESLEVAKREVLDNLFVYRFNKDRGHITKIDKPEAIYWGTVLTSSCHTEEEYELDDVILPRGINQFISDEAEVQLKNALVKKGIALNKLEDWWIVTRICASILK